MTSTFGITSPKVDGYINRILKLNLDLASGQVTTGTNELLATEWNNQTGLRRVISDFKPDVAFFWNMRGLSLSLVSTVRAMGLPACFYISDDWLAVWTEQNDVWFNLWSRPAKFAISKVAKPLFESALGVLQIQTDPTRLEDGYYAFTSQYVRMTTLQSGKTFPHSIVVHHGIDPAKFVFLPRVLSDTYRLLYVGRLVSDKGVHTAIEAVRILRDNYDHASLTFDIVGTSPDREYMELLKRMIEDSRLQDMIHFLGFAQREEMQAIYDDHDVLIFPSIWEEPFSIALIEAMSSGLVVVGTASGGSSEILADDENSLVFERGNAEMCAAQINRLVRDRDLYDRLRVNARRSVESSYSFDTMIDQLEMLLSTTETELNR